MTQMVRVAVAADTTEAEEIQAILREAGIPSDLEADADADALAVLVPDSAFESAQEAIEALTEPDDVAGS